MWEWWEAFWQGRVTFLARGEKLAQFLTEAWRDRIAFYHTRKSARGLRAEVGLGDFKRLRRAARVTNTRVRIKSKRGLPFVLARWQRRKGLVAGLVIITLGIAIASQLVLFVTVSGAQSVDADQLMQKAADLGLKKWVWHRELDLNSIAQSLQEQTPEAAWIGVERTGTKIEIKIVEKKRPQVPSEAGSLIAAKTGLVQDIMVIQGTPVVHAGELVREGQTLIKPAPKYAEHPDAGATPPEMAARGFVRGRVWYSGEGKVPLVEDQKLASGAEAHGWGIKIGSRVIMVTTPSSPYELTETEVQTQSLPSWRNWQFPVEIITVTYRELETVHVERTVAEARALAEKLARSTVEGLITPGATVVEELVRVITAEAGIEHVRVEVETYEDLAVYADP